MTTMNSSNLRTLAVGYRSALIGALTLLVVCGVMAATARADYYFTYNEVGFPVSPNIYSVQLLPGPDDPVNNPGTASVTNANSGSSAGDFAISSISTSDSGSSAIDGDVSTTSISVENSGAGPHTLYIHVYNSDFTLPSGPQLSVIEELSATKNPADGTLTLYSVFTPLSPTGTAVQLPTVTVDTLQPGNPGSSAADASMDVVQTGTGYELDQVIELMVSGGEKVSLTATTDVVPVPEPGRVIGLLGIASMLGVGLLIQFRRRAAV